MNNKIKWLQDISKDDIQIVGGKNASLGEMISNLTNLGIKVPGGFATMTHAFNEFLELNKLDEFINKRLQQLDVNNVSQLTQAGKQIREAVINSHLPESLIAEVTQAYQTLQAGSHESPAVAVRSSATAEDLPNASFAGQQETFLNIKGIDNVLEAIKLVYASLYNDRAIAYRVHQNITHIQVSISATIQLMVNSDIGASGVLFTIDTESGFEDAVCITGSYGLGETIVQGEVNPDEFTVYKPALAQGRTAILSRKLGQKAHKMIYTNHSSANSSVEITEVALEDRNRFCITDEQVHELSRQALLIEQHYKCPMDIEWALDGKDNGLYIVQARPETVVSKKSKNIIQTYRLKQHGERLIEGRAIGQRIGAGVVRVLNDISQMDSLNDGDILVTQMTDPDWEPVMKRASAIITDQGGRTCHAAIIARELGVPAIVGCQNATQVLSDGLTVTASCAEGDTGYVYQGKLDFETIETNVEKLPDISTSIMMNLADPGRAFGLSQMPNAGVGLARLEFIINNQIGIHPKALLNYDQQTEAVKCFIDSRMQGYASPVEFYVGKLTEGIATITAAFSPNKVIVRMSDFKSNEYANLIGGDKYESNEENPMIGFRGASRYLSEEFADCFELECQAIKRVRENMGLTNVEIMIPFCRTVEEARSVLDLLKQHGLEKGSNGLRIIMMCEIPSNAIQAEEFLQYFDGFSIGSNDMTQLALGLDRDSAKVAYMFDERNSTVKTLISMAINACKKENKYIGICGQAPSDYPDFAQWLQEEGITSLSLNPDTVISTWQHLGKSRVNNVEALKPVNGQHRQRNTKLAEQTSWSINQSERGYNHGQFVAPGRRAHIR